MRKYKIALLLLLVLPFFGNFCFGQCSENDRFDYENFDAECFNRILFSLLNKQREKGRKKALNYSYELQEMAEEHLATHRGSYYKFHKTRGDRIIRKMRQDVDLTYRGTYLSCGYTYLPALHFDSKSRYDYKENPESETGFYDVSNQKKQIAPIDFHTYGSLALQVLKRLGFTNKVFRHSKSYEDFGCAIAVEQKSPTRMPWIKLVCLAGGFRLGSLR